MIKYDYVKTRRQDVQEIPANSQGVARIFIKLFTTIECLGFQIIEGAFVEKISLEGFLYA